MNLHARALFINSGILGHRSVAGLLQTITRRLPGIEAQHINLSDHLTISDRIVRRLLGLRMAPITGPAANLDLRRWRQELNVGWLAARRIRAAEQQGAFDVLHFHPQATAYASLARMKRTPSIVSIDSTQHLAREEARSRLGRFTYQASIAHDGSVFRAARAIIATSAWAVRNLEATYPDCAGKLHVMPYPIDVGRFDSRWVDERRERGRIHPRDPVRVLFIGGDFERKGGADLLAAWREGGFAPHAELELITDWPLPGDEVPPGVLVTSGVTSYSPRWFEAWRRADLFVMPTRSEAFGMVFQEAAASGLPCVATDITAIPETVQDGQTGILVRRGHRGDLIGAMRTLIDSAELRNRMGIKARQHIQERADPALYAEKLRSLLEQVAGSNGHQRT